jgi:hypothetical protein
MAQIRSDPIYPSSGKPRGYYENYIQGRIVQYRDPASDGLEEDIIETHRSNDQAAKQLLNEDESVRQW